MAGTLYIVATPIGNLEDMPPRVAATFGAADFIAAEDTRVTMKLLNFLGLKATPECPACPTRARSSCGTHWRGASK